MCGIAGVVSFKNENNIDVVKKMTTAIAHRGPDNEGIWNDDFITFGHRRLSIIDLSESGNQPMLSSDNKISIVFNGEIYNYPELKQNMEKKGHVFHSTSDTEVILALYKEYGHEAPVHLNGIFAFAIWDKEKKELFAVRDFFGVKPFYYYQAEQEFIFSSEIKAILQCPGYHKDLDTDALHSFLTFRFNPAPQTLFKGIKKLNPGHCVCITSLGKTKFWKYDLHKPIPNRKINFNEAKDEYLFLLENAVKRQLLSDVPVSLFLSGGVDSAAIGLIMQKHVNYQINSFTVGFEGKGDFNEFENAQISADYIGSKHHNHTITQNEFFDSYLKSFYAIEEPIGHNSSAALHIVSKVASASHKVAVSGQGADEVMLGYDRYKGEKLISEYAGLLSLVPWKLAAKIYPFSEQIYRFKSALRFNNEIDRFLSIYSIFDAEQIALLLKPEILKTIQNENINLISELYNTTINFKKDSLNKLQYIDTRLLSDNLLVIEDKVSMDHSLEVRVPYLDIELVRFLESLPSSFKMKGFTNKYLHKKALEKWLPKQILYRKKLGFDTPFDDWLHTNLGDFILNTITAEESACVKYFNKNYIRKIFSMHKKKQFNFERHIYLLFSFEVWYNYFFRNQTMKIDF